MSRRAWLDAVVAAGATAASFAPDGSGGRVPVEDVTGAELLEDPELRIHDVPADTWRPPSAAFLDGVQSWRVVAYDGIVPIARAWVAAAVRRRGPDRRLRTVHEVGREMVVTFPDRLRPAVRDALQARAPELRAAPAEQLAQPAQALTALRFAVEGERVRAERAVGERWLDDPPAHEWLVVDGVLSDHALLGAHSRTLGVIKSHGAHYFSGPEQERALTIPAGRRTSVFRPAARGSTAVYSWYLRLWPWEGHDLLYGLVRVEGPARAATLERAGALSSWLLAERAPLAAPDARWDRLVYPLHDVETYLRAAAPRDIVAPVPPRLPARGGGA
jgi:hypothetical protein